jgi:hypothetical protein
LEGGKQAKGVYIVIESEQIRQFLALTAGCQWWKLGRMAGVRVLGAKMDRKKSNKNR